MKRLRLVASWANRWRCFARIIRSGSLSVISGATRYVNKLQVVRVKGRYLLISATISYAAR
jgi:hypothetical protein